MALWDGIWHYLALFWHCLALVLAWTEGYTGPTFSKTGPKFSKTVLNPRNVQENLIELLIY